MFYEIYMHVNKINKKAYVGFTKHDMEYRWKEHLKTSRSTKEKRYFYNALRKYKKNDWLHQVLEIADSEEEAAKIEVKYIKLFSTNNRKYGYNSTEGGDVSPLKYLTREQRAEYNKLRIGKIYTKYTKEMLFEAAGKCTTQAQLANYFNCTAAHISYLLKIFKIKNEISKILNKRETPSKEKLFEIAESGCKTKREIGRILGYTNSYIGDLIKKYDIKNEINTILKENKDLYY